nr:long chain fatty acid-CoA synthetase [Mycolicibacterium hodleri]
MPLQPTLRRAHTPFGSSRQHRIAPRVNCPTVGQSFDIEIGAEFDGWLIQIPEIGGVTRARRRATVELAARECIAAMTGIPIGYVSVFVTRETVGAE